MAIKAQRPHIILSKKNKPLPVQNAQVYFRTFICTDNNHYKFYELTITQKTTSCEVMCKWGRIGTEGQMKIENFAYPEDATRWANKKAGEKLSKGYKETTDNSEQYQDFKRNYEETPASKEKFDLFLSLLK